MWWLPYFSSIAPPQNISRALGSACVLAVFFVSNSLAAGKGNSVDHLPTLQREIGDLEVVAPLDASKIESVMGVNLHLSSSESAIAFRYEADEVRLADATIEKVEYREWSNERQSRNYILVLNLAPGSKCLSRSQIQHLYMPQSRDVDSDGGGFTYLIRHEPWGDLNFGFLVNEPNCACSVGFKSKGA